MCHPCRRSDLSPMSPVAQRSGRVRGYGGGGFALFFSTVAPHPAAPQLAFSLWEKASVHCAPVALHSGRCASPSSSAPPTRASTARPAISTSTRRGRSPRALITHGHSDHARRGHGAVLATPETLKIMAERYGDGFCRLDAGGGARRGDRDRRRRRHLPSRRPCARLGADRGGEGRHAHRRLGRLQAPRRPDLPRLRAGALRRLHHRGDLRAAGLPPSRRPRRDPKAARLGRASSPSARISSAPMRSARRSASSRCCARPAMTSRSTSTARCSGSATSTRRRASTSARWSRRRSRRAGKHDFAGTIVIGPPSAFADRWARRFADPVACFASGWMRMRQRARQRGVELPLVISDHCDWDELCDTIREVAPAGGVGDARPRGGAGALVRAAGHPREAAASDGLRGGAGMSDARSEADIRALFAAYGAGFDDADAGRGDGALRLAGDDLAVRRGPRLRGCRGAFGERRGADRRLRRGGHRARPRRR